jgi:hypothetical protein
MNKELGKSLKDSLILQLDCFERELKQLSFVHGKSNLTALFLLCFRKMLNQYRNCVQYTNPFSYFEQKIEVTDVIDIKDFSYLFNMACV